MEPPVPPVVAGYHVGELLGRGSSGTVWAARRTADGRRVAVKFCAGSASTDDAAARELGRLRGVGGEHVVTLLDAVPVRSPVGGLALVTERFDGGSLAQVVAARGRLTEGEVVTVLSPLAAALGGLHRSGLVHGDVAPGNVLFDELGRPALCDLGVSRIVGEQVDQAWGTPGFVAPQVVMGEPPTPASDVYAVGALGWFALTGQSPEPPWLRGSATEAMPDVAPALLEALERALRADPGSRPDAAALSVELFDAVPAVALRLPGSVTEVDLLTRRIRAAARVEEPDPPATGRARRWRIAVSSWRGSPGGRLAPRRGADAAGSATDASPAPERVQATATKAPARSGRHRSRRRRAAQGSTVAVLAAVFLAVGGLVAMAASWANGPPPTGLPHETTAGGAGDTSARQVAQPAPTDPLGGRSGIPAHASGLAQGLADARARVWTSARPNDALAGLDAAGSAAFGADSEALARASAGGWHYQDVRFTVRAATVEAVSPDAVKPTSATLRMVVDSAAYAVVGPQGRVRRPATRGTAVRLRLAWTAAGWRVVQVSPG